MFYNKTQLLVVAWVEDINIRQSRMQRSVYLIKPSTADGEMTDVPRIANVETGIYTFFVFSKKFWNFFIVIAWLLILLNHFHLFAGKFDEKLLIIFAIFTAIFINFITYNRFATGQTCLKSEQRHHDIKVNMFKVGSNNNETTSKV